MVRVCSLVIVILLGAVLAVACNGEDESSSEATATTAATLAPASSPTPEPATTAISAPSATATVPAELPTAFRDFVREELAPALADGDIAFFAQHAITEPIVCTPDNTPSLPGGPDCQTVGDQFDGFVLGPYQSELFVVPIQDALDVISLLQVDEATGSVDSFGDAMRRIVAFGVPPASWTVEDGGSRLVDGPYYATVLTALIEGPIDMSPTRFPDVRRFVVVLNWLPDGEGFALSSVITALTTSDSLLEFGPESWPLWVPYEP